MNAAILKAIEEEDDDSIASDVIFENGAGADHSVITAAAAMITSTCVDRQRHYSSSARLYGRTENEIEI